MEKWKAPKRPKIVKGKYVVILIIAAILAYAGLIYLALNNLANSKLFMILLGAMVLLPSLIMFPVYHSITTHFGDIVKKLDEAEGEEEEQENK